MVVKLWASTLGVTSNFVKHTTGTSSLESVWLRVEAFAGTLFAAADERLRGLTRRYRLQPQRSMAYPRT